MDRFLVSRTKVRRFFEPPAGSDLDGLAVVERPGALPEGTPFFVDSDMQPVEPLCSYFFDLSKTVVASTMADYAGDLMDAVDFLAGLEPPSDLLSACEDDLVAYREDRTLLQAAPVSPATWRRRRVALNGFYDWAVHEGLVERRPYHRRRNGRDALSWGAVAVSDVRALSVGQWRFLKRVGLRGLRPDGSADPRFRGASPLRDSVAGEVAMTTGIRLREFSSLLDIEVGTPRADAGAVVVRLEAVAKFGLSRDVAIQDTVLREIEMYRRTERARVVAASTRTLARHRSQWFVVDNVGTRRMRVGGLLHGRRRSFQIAAMTAPLRRITMVEGVRGLEPMACGARVRVCGARVRCGGGCAGQGVCVQGIRRCAARRCGAGADDQGMSPDRCRRPSGGSGWSYVDRPPK